MSDINTEQDWTTPILSMIAVIGIFIIVFLYAIMPAEARGADPCTYDNNGRVICMGSGAKQKAATGRHARRLHRTSRVIDANGNRAIVRSSSGVSVKVASSARAALQCIVDYVETHGVRIKAMRGYGPGTVRGSLHPSGRALDINQMDRNITRPHVPRTASNAAADRCGVISGARWSYSDNGHWNLSQTGRPSEPWPRAVRAEALQ